MKRIKIIQQGDKYMAYFEDLQRLMEIANRPSINTFEEVRAMMQKVNPDYIVTFDRNGLI